MIPLSVFSSATFEYFTCSPFNLEIVGFEQISGMKALITCRVSVSPSRVLANPRCSHKEVQNDWKQLRARSDLAIDGVTVPAARKFIFAGLPLRFYMIGTYFTGHPN